ncbi:MAG TPA: putative porin [Ferruginibacter sp.]|nr:putative porin [Ferruginibacter sp.]
MKKIILGLILLLCYQFSHAQLGGALGGKLSGIGGGGGGSKSGSGSGSDTAGIGFESRREYDAKDSNTIRYKYLDSSRSNKFERTPLNDFYQYFPIPETEQYLGNTGNAGYSIVYAPQMKIGWDAGFHAFDVYRFALEDTKFFKTDKPVTVLNYEVASGKEQIVSALHTQNPKPNFNFGFEYRLINAPGFFVTQNTNHNNFRVFSTYQGKRKRYNASLIVISNSLKSSENGGVVDYTNLSDPNYSKRFTVPVKLGGDAAYAPSPFQVSVFTGNTYKDVTAFLRQSYDFGKKDSIAINDSTTNYLFYPKLRFQHTFTFSSYTYQFQDVAVDETDTGTYSSYGIQLRQLNGLIPLDTFLVKEKWSVITNDFSILQFPDTKNQAQFFSVGARLENIHGNFINDAVTNDTTSNSYYNAVAHAEYRNKTRNKLWDIDARGEIYLNGLNSGDYGVYATLGRYLNKTWGNIRLTFDNISRSPSFIYNSASAFSFGNSTLNKKENITMMSATAENRFVNLSATNYVIDNLPYFSNYTTTSQYTTIFNLLQLTASKKIKLTKYWNWYIDLILQQTDGGAPVKVPLLFTRNRIAFEGHFSKNLDLSTGLDIRYYTAYDAYNYSPVVGQFFTQQNAISLNNKPDVSAFLHARIKSFTAYIRAENLNAVNFANGFDFTNNNYAVPRTYAYPGFIFRLGISWNFIN